MLIQLTRMALDAFAGLQPLMNTIARTEYLSNLLVLQKLFFELLILFVLVGLSAGELEHQLAGHRARLFMSSRRRAAGGVRAAMQGKTKHAHVRTLIEISTRPCATHAHSFC